MTAAPFTSLQRVLTTLAHREPDRVPFFLLLTMHGAKVLGLSIRDYFAPAANVVEGQIRLRERFGHDCLNGFFYAAVEVEAWGSEVIFAPDGPPLAGAGVIHHRTDIDRLEPPPVEGTPCLRRVLEALAGMKARIGDDAPIIGVVMSPFSLPVMQMGFEHYLDLLHEEPARFERLMQVNEAFCVAWANAQLAAGATVICYFDPVSSPSMVPREMYLRTGHRVATRTLSRIKGPTATHFGSGRCLPILDDVHRTGTGAVAVSVLEDLVAVKAACAGKLTVIGNLNAIEMRRWSAADATAAVRAAIARAGRGGGYILADNHGEIPWQVPDEALQAVADAVRTYGTYPLHGMRDEP